MNAPADDWKKIEYNLSSIVDAMEARVTEQQQLIEQLKIPPVSLEDAIFRKYIELRSVKGVADYLKSIDIKKSSTAYFHPKDISRIIYGDQPSAHPAIVKFSGQVFCDNLTAVSKRYG